MANGDIVTTKGRVTVVLLCLQGTKFFVYCFTLLLGGYDDLLGIQWLLKLGPIFWDFSQLIMSFKLNERSVHLKFLVPSTANMVDN